MIFKNAQIEPSSACNLRCLFCRKPQKENHLMTMDDFFLICNLISKSEAQIKEFHFCGNGEPLLNKNVGKFLKEIKRLFPLSKIKITSNLNINIDYYLKDIIKYCDTLSVSVDGFSEKTYRKIRRGGDLGLVIKNISKINSQLKNSGSRCKLNLNFTVNEHNISDIINIKNFCNRHDIKSALIWRISSLKDRIYSHQNQKKWHNNIKLLLKDKTKSIKIRYAPIPDFYIKIKNRCNSPLEWLNITSELNIAPCCEIWDKNQLKKLKMPRITKSTENIKEVWHDKGLTAFRKKMKTKDNKTCKECHWNYYPFTT